MKIVVVVDAQRDFIDGALGTPEAIEASKNIENFLSTGIDQIDDLVIFTQDTHYNTYMETSEGKHLPVTHCILNSDGWGIKSDLLKVVDEPEFVTKYTFGSSKLAEMILNTTHYHGVEEIVLVGFCTDICVISNALIIQERLRDDEMEEDAVVPPIVVYSNCCAGTTPENHRAAIRVMNSCQIEIKEWF